MRGFLARGKPEAGPRADRQAARRPLPGVDFTTPYLEIEFGYVAAPRARLEKAADTDRLGVRIAAVENGSPEGHLRRTLRTASLIPVKGGPDALNLLKTGGADAFFALKANLASFVTNLPGSKILPGASGAEQHALGIPKERSTPGTLALAQRFVDEAKANGTVKTAIDRANMRAASIPLAK